MSLITFDLPDAARYKESRKRPCMLEKETLFSRRSALLASLHEAVLAKKEARYKEFVSQSQGRTLGKEKSFARSSALVAKLQNDEGNGYKELSRCLQPPLVKVEQEIFDHTTLLKEMRRKITQLSVERDIQSARNDNLQKRLENEEALNEELRMENLNLRRRIRLHQNQLSLYLGLKTQEKPFARVIPVQSDKGPRQFPGSNTNLMANEGNQPVVAPNRNQAVSAGPPGIGDSEVLVCMLCLEQFPGTLSLDDKKAHLEHCLQLCDIN